jgi:hypothetical protein
MPAAGRVTRNLTVGLGEGQSIADLAPDGRLRRVYGFRDPLPPSTP